MSACKENWNRVPRWLRIVIYSILGALGMAALGVLFGLIIMWLWNWLMPGLFGLKAITYWQGIGIFILAKILFGAIGSGGSAKKAKDKKERLHGPRSCEERKAEPESVEYYDEWWESEGKKAFEEYAGKKRDGGRD
jgi:hypothetical protein